jgi:FkbH-like protein
VHEGEVGFATVEPDPAAALDAEVARWTSLWDLLAARTTARVIQWNFPVPDTTPFGHLGARLPGARPTLVQALNLRLGQAAGTMVGILDCERLSASFGKERWFDPRYWHLSKQAVALGAVPLVARHLAAVIAAHLGLSKKCLVLDLDNTLWGGVVGEDGLTGIRVGGDAEGEAYVAFQEHVLALKARGVILAVCSKNNEADAKEPFEKHPEMRLRLEDISVFVANWESKPDQLRQIAKILDIGTDALVFVDDNPVEREAMRQLCPEIDVVALPADPALYARALSQHLALEPASFTVEDTRRTEQYRARAEAARLEASASSLDEFLESLEMRAVVKPIDDLDLERVVQLMGKTNQFNLTNRRHGRAQVERFVADPDCVHLTLRLADRFTDHGLVSVLVATRDGDALDIDTWLMSCRVIGRTVEAQVLQALSARALAAGCTRLRGTYVPSAKNGMVADVYGRFGFQLLGTAEDGTTTWEYDLEGKGPVQNRFIASAAIDASEEAAP